jgi:hypothetical protein
MFELLLLMSTWLLVRDEGDESVIKNCDQFLRFIQISRVPSIISAAILGSIDVYPGYTWAIQNGC